MEADPSTRARCSGTLKRMLCHNGTLKHKVWQCRGAVLFGRRSCQTNITNAHTMHKHRSRIDNLANLTRANT